MTRKKLDYLIKLKFDPEYKGYVADVVNLYGCMSQGKTKTEALRNAEKAISAFMTAVTKSESHRAEFTKRTVITSFPAF